MKRKSHIAMAAAALAAIVFVAYAMSHGLLGQRASRPRCPKRLVLENAALRAEIVPAWGGRLMSFGRPGGANALWTEPDAVTNTVDKFGFPRWKNVGGEKTWVGVMSLWKDFKPADEGYVGWPPPAWFDSAPLEAVRVNANNILLRSAAHTSGDWTVALEREFTLLPDRLVLRERLVDCAGAPSCEAVSDDPRRVWSVTQIPFVPRVRGRICGEGRQVLERDGKPRFPAPRPAGAGWIELDMDSTWKDAKLDFDGDALAAPLADGSGDWLVIEQTAARSLDAFETPSRAIVYTVGKDSPHPYIELEFVALGPDAAQTLEFRLAPFSF